MKQFVFVLGAGASVDLNLPIGSELTGQIQSALNFRSDGYAISGGDDLLRRTLSNSRQQCPQWFEASKLIASAMPLAPSIDNFVDVHKSDSGIAFCAKAAITKCILDAERKSSIYVDPSNTYNTINFQGNIKAWHTLFFRILTTNCVIEDLPERLRKIGVISFNYDRCFEHYLLHAISVYYKISKSDSAEILNNLEIYHPYGRVGELPEFAKSNSIGYGADISEAQLIDISSQIRTFTESIDEESSDIKLIREMAFETNNLVFLGFAFHSLNMRLILPNGPKGISYQKRVLATALGSSTSDLAIIGGDLSNRYKCDHVAVDLRKDLTCSQLFMEYSRTLSLA